MGIKITATIINKLELSKNKIKSSKKKAASFVKVKLSTDVCIKILERQKTLHPAHKNKIIEHQNQKMNKG